jgi:hypothetical protein
LKTERSKCLEHRMHQMPSERERAVTCVILVSELFSDILSMEAASSFEALTPIYLDNRVSHLR